MRVSAGGDGVLPTPLGDLSLTTATVLWALVAVVATFFCSRWASQATLRLAHRVQGVHADLALRAARLVRYFVLAMGAGVVLAVLGANIQPLLVGVLLILGAALLMLRGIADNLGAGLVIQTRRPVQLGDLVECGGFVGRVGDLNSRSVVLVASDGRTIHLPNGLVMDGPLVNHSRRGVTRSDLVVQVHRADAGAESVRLRSLVQGTAVEVRGISIDPAPSVLVMLIADHRVGLLLQVWHEPGEGPSVCSRVAVSVHEALSATGVASEVSWPPVRRASTGDHR